MIRVKINFMRENNNTTNQKKKKIKKTLRLASSFFFISSCLLLSSFTEGAAGLGGGFLAALFSTAAFKSAVKLEPKSATNGWLADGNAAALLDSNLLVSSGIEKGSLLGDPCGLDLGRCGGTLLFNTTGSCCFGKARSLFFKRFCCFFRTSSACCLIASRFCASSFCLASSFCFCKA